MTTPFPFVSGAVLQAQQLNDITNLPINDQTASYVLVVGDAGKRVIMNNASATTITVNNSVFTTGDTIFIANKGAGTSTITAGAGVTVNTSDSLALAQYQSGQLVALSASSFLFFPSAETAPASGLTLISTTTIGSAVSSVTVSNAFSATYDAYRITITGGTSTNNTNLNLQLGAVTSGYRNQLLYASYNNTPLALGSTGGSNFLNVGAGNSSRLAMSVDVLNPYLAKPTTVGPSSNSGTGDAGVFMGYLDGTDQFTAFTVIVQTGTATGGEIRVYGYKN